MLKTFLTKLLFVVFCISAAAQEVVTEKSISTLFRSGSPLYLKLDYSKDEIKANRKDTIYSIEELEYSEDNNNWKTIETRIIGRGNFRYKVCYFTPLKLKIKKSKSVNTLFQGHKTLKLVLPCLKGSDMNDNVIKEYLAYKFYEELTPYSFNTRLLNVSIDELKGGQRIKHNVKGFLIEDDKVLAKRLNAKVIDVPTDPKSHDDKISVINAFFQFLIANVDFSTAYSHNSKMLAVNDNYYPVPYDFDLSGFVNPVYGFVPQSAGGEPLGIKKITDRKYRGFKRDFKIYNEVRALYLSKKQFLIKIMQNHKKYFDTELEFEEAKNFLLSFYQVLESDTMFNSMILEDAR